MWTAERSESGHERKSGTARGTSAIGGECRAGPRHAPAGPYDRLLVNDDNAFAHSSPVYCTVDGAGPRNAEDARFFISWIAQLIERVESSDRFADEGQRTETVELFRKAQACYRAGTERPPAPAN